jgi:hypothetical protein
LRVFLSQSLTHADALVSSSGLWFQHSSSLRTHSFPPCGLYRHDSDVDRAQIRGMFSNDLLTRKECLSAGGSVPRIVPVTSCQGCSCIYAPRIPFQVIQHDLRITIPNNGSPASYFHAGESSKSCRTCSRRDDALFKFTKQRQDHLYFAVFMFRPEGHEDSKTSLSARY